VDVFHDKNEGLTIAEIELGSEDEWFEKPEWLGDEVTGRREYYNAYLIK
jgi:CYTH domain-containing protein